MADPQAAKDEAIAIVCAKHLHQSLWLPKTASHERLRVTFATTSNFQDTTLPVILFCPPMFAGRTACLTCDHMAKTTGVRVISVDRPSMGGSTPVPLSERVKVWLDTVPAILERLNVAHIDVLLTHSAGTIYSLNTLYYLRDRLSPIRPSVVFIAPWVHNAHSDATLMTVAARLPTGMVGNLHNVTKFINKQVMPVTSWSGGLLSSISDLFQASPANQASSDPNGDPDPYERYGTSSEVGEVIERLAATYFFAEDISGGSEEAKLCLKKGAPGSWGVCDDYREFVRIFVKEERARKASNPQHAKLRVDSYFAESDMMIGKAGQKYFEECWRQTGVEEVVRFESTDLPETNHETVILDMRKGALRKIFEKVAAAAAYEQSQKRERGDTRIGNQ